MSDGSVKDSMQPILNQRQRQRKYASDQEAKEANRLRNKEHYWKNRDAIRERQNKKYLETKTYAEEYKKTVLHVSTQSPTQAPAQVSAPTFTQNSTTYPVPDRDPIACPPAPVLAFPPLATPQFHPLAPPQSSQPIGVTSQNNVTPSLIQPPNLNYDANNQPFNATNFSNPNPNTPVNYQTAFILLPNGTQYPIMVPNGNQYNPTGSNGNQYNPTGPNGNQYIPTGPNGSQYNMATPNTNQYVAPSINPTIVSNGNQYPAMPLNNMIASNIVPVTFDRKY